MNATKGFILRKVEEVKMEMTTDGSRHQIKISKARGVGVEQH